MSFDTDLADFAHLLGGRAQAAFEATVAEVRRSVVEGSGLTGAPGQPVGETGDLRASWQEERPAPFVAVVLSHDPGARTIEKGTRLGRRLHRRSARGGFHSVKLTRVHFRQIVSAVNRRVGGDD